MTFEFSQGPQLGNIFDIYSLQQQFVRRQSYVEYKLVNLTVPALNNSPNSHVALFLRYTIFQQ